jgi:hypothetical protein
MLPCPPLPPLNPLLSSRPGCTRLLVRGCGSGGETEAAEEVARRKRLGVRGSRLVGRGFRRGRPGAEKNVAHPSFYNRRTKRTDWSTSFACYPYLGLYSKSLYSNPCTRLSSRCARFLFALPQNLFASLSAPHRPLLLSCPWLFPGSQALSRSPKLLPESWLFTWSWLLRCAHPGACGSVEEALKVGGGSGGGQGSGRRGRCPGGMVSTVLGKECSFSAQEGCN